MIENDKQTPDIEETEAEAPEPEAAAAEKPKRRRAARKKAAPKAKAAKDTEATEESADEPQADEAEAPAPSSQLPAPETKKRRGSADVAASKKRSKRPKPDAAPVYVRAQAKYVRSSPRKARLVVDHIRGKSADEARAILGHTPRAAAEPVLKVLESALANAEHNHELLPEELRVFEAFVDEGPTIKRYRPRALGRATRIRKRTSHITINLTNRA